MRDRPEMMSSTMPSAKYSCSGSLLMFWNGSTAIDGLSGIESEGPPVADAPSGAAWAAWSVASCAAPTKRMPLRGSVLIRRCSSPLSASAVRAQLAVCREQSLRGSPGARVLPHVQAAVPDHELLEQLRPAPVS